LDQVLLVVVIHQYYQEWIDNLRIVLIVNLDNQIMMIIGNRNLIMINIQVLVIKYLQKVMETDFLLIIIQISIALLLNSWNSIIFCYKRNRIVIIKVWVITIILEMANYKNQIKISIIRTASKRFKKRLKRKMMKMKILSINNKVILKKKIFKINQNKKKEFFLKIDYKS
jgi:hypothetical protein